MGMLVQEKVGPASAVADKLALPSSRLMNNGRRLKIVATLIVPPKTFKKVNHA
jgi:hypothetical protein